MGVQLDAAYQLGNGFNIGGTLLWQDTEYKDGSVVSDGRRASPAGGACWWTSAATSCLARRR